MIHLTDIAEAHQRIGKYIHCTPVLTSRSINAMAGADLFFKCENFQKAGAFKFRGACNAVFSLSGDEMSKGVCTHSSGNFAQALALAASMRNIPAYIVMPRNASPVKVAAVEGYGGIIYFCEPTLAAREETAAAVIAKTGARFVHPYDDYKIIAGQGTAAFEAIRQTEKPDIVIAPVGGGGLLSGTAIAAKESLPGVQVIAAEPLGANDAFRSFYSRTWTPSVKPDTIADGLLTSLGERNFPIILQYVDQILTCTEPGITHAMKLMWERMKIVVEPSSAVPLACMLEHPSVFAGKKVLVIVSGGNVDLSRHWFE